MPQIQWLSGMQQLFPLVCAGIGFVYGVCKFFKSKKPLYAQIIVCALGCMALGRLYMLVSYLSLGEPLSGIHVGYLGYIGCFMFIFSANYGQMDGLVDGRERSIAKYRLIAVIAPLLLLGMAALILKSGAILSTKIATIATIVLTMGASYYTLKHLIIPDVEAGIVACIRKYNALALALCFLTSVELLGIAFDNSFLQYIAIGLEGILYLMIIPVLERGIKRWTT